MKNIIMRAAMSPLDDTDAYQVLMNNTIGNNIGNMLFPFSMYRALTMDDTFIQNYNAMDPKDADEINEKYDCFVIPLANAFRASFMKTLRNMTALIQKLTIPCVVVSAGLQTELEPDLKRGFPFDQDVKDFVSAVLDKSASMSVRGEITAAYLKKLGFDERYVKVNGCPSMYMNGRTLPFKGAVRELTQDSMICMNSKSDIPKAAFDFFDRCKQELPNYYYIAQDLIELRLLYAGVPFDKKVPDQFMSKPSDDMYLADRVRTFINVPSWLQFMKQADFTFGTRIHGCVAAIQAGTPVFLFTNDSRTRELSEFFGIPHMSAKDITEDTNILDIYEKTDFTSVLKGHEQRFDNFMSFLKENGLEPVYQTGEEKQLPFDRQMDRVLAAPVKTLNGCTPEERAYRLEQYYGHLQRKEKKLQDKVAALEKKTKKKKWFF